MPKMMIMSVAAASAFAGAAVTYLAAGRRMAVDSVRGLSPYFDRFRRNAGDSVRAAVAGPPMPVNSAFEDYRAETIRNLEDEQRELTAFLERLRRARDREEFDAWRADRQRHPGNASADTLAPVTLS